MRSLQNPWMTRFCKIRRFGSEKISLFSMIEHWVLQIFANFFLGIITLTKVDQHIGLPGQAGADGAPFIDAPLRALESLDNAVGHSSEFSERGNKRLRDKQAGFVERYLNGDMEIAIRRIDVGPPYYGALFEAGPNVGKPKSSGVRFGGDNHRTGQEMDSDQLLMFAQNVELVKHEEKVIPSSVRLQLFEDLHFDKGKPLFTFSHVFWVPKRVDGRINGKMAFSTGRLAVPYCERGGQQIEAASNAIYDGADARIDSAGQSSIDFELKELLSHFRVRLFDNQIRGSLDPGFERLFDNWELGYGPIDG